MEVGASNAKLRLPREAHHLTPIFKKWHDINVEYCKAVDKDAVYWNTERVNVGALAAAVWLRHSQALEEFSAGRSFGRHQRQGRADLCFNWCGTDYVIEAKHEWVCLSPQAGDAAKRFDPALKRARKAAVESRYQGKRRLGIVFAVPYIHKQYADHSRPLVDKFLARLKEGVDYCAMCSVFPPPARRLQARGHLFPGVVLLARMPRRNLPR
ncbi:MAG TPA: hypothetical protein PK280_04490 [Planctomycetota bacterium]|nr:hypothetical protein [Planctomycetota bacterium]